MNDIYMPIHIDPEFKPYIDLFESISGRKVNMSVVLGDIPIMYDGTCIGEYKIVIQRSYWFDPNTTYNNKEEVILHELGHCILHRNHVLTIGPVGYFTFVPLSIMYPFSFGSESYYEINKQYYYKELVDGY